MTADPMTEARRLAQSAKDHVVIAIDGRTFRLGTRFSFDNDLYLLSELSASGLIEAFRALGSAPSLDGARATLVVEGFRSGRLFALLAGMLHEDGTSWTRAGAEANAALFASVSDRDAKLALLEALVIGTASAILNSLPPLPRTAAGIAK